MGGFVILRVISGTAKGSRLKTLKGDIVRPTSDMVKESLFNIIAENIKGAFVLDLFSGTGSLGIEALSRGAEHAVFVEKRADCIRIIKENLTHTKLTGKSEVIPGDVFKAALQLSGSMRKFDIVFLDPPYYKNFVDKTLKLLEKSDIINDNGMIIAESHIGDVVSERIDKLELIREKRYGDTILSFYMPSKQ